MKIKIEQLHKNFGKVKVLQGLDLNVTEKGIFAILGPNGSGKTTLIKCILGMVIPQKGDILLDNQSILGQWDYRSKVAYLPQIARFPQNLKVQELIKMIKEIRGDSQREEEIINLFKIQPFLDKKLGTLSGGTKQKINILLTFMFDSDLIILDEPTTGLDPVALIYLKELIQEEKRKGKTILVTTHIMKLVEEIADKIVFLLDGKIYFEGTVTQLQSQTGEKDLEHAIANILKDTYA